VDNTAWAGRAANKYILMNHRLVGPEIFIGKASWMGWEEILHGRAIKFKENL
jgi:hypothetical protein